MPVEFARTVLPHGTTAVITDPHEITNVCGISGIEYMLSATKGLPVDVYFMVPSCVPSTPFDESGYILKAADLEVLYNYERVLGLAEVMDYVGTIEGEDDLLNKITYAKERNKIVDGHAPGLQEKEACAYIAAGISSDHECVDIEEALQKLSLGQWIMIREGTAAKNLEALMGLFQAPYYHRAMLVSDDKNPNELLEYGHLDDTIRLAVKRGANPCVAIKMVTLNPATYFGLKDTGAIAPGYKADIVILSDLQEMKIDKVIKNGKLVVDGSNEITIQEPAIDEELLSSVYHSFHCRELIPEDFLIKLNPDYSYHYIRAIQLMKDEITTKELKVPLCPGIPEISVEKDILKIAAIERHHNTNHIGLGYVHGYGLRNGAIASSVAHDSHNIIVIGTNDTDMAVAANCIRDMQGGWAIAKEGNIIDRIPLPIAGLMSDWKAEELAIKIDEIKSRAYSLGVKEGIDPFMTMAFVSLPVIPELRIITTGLFDVTQQKHVTICVEE